VGDDGQTSVYDLDGPVPVVLDRVIGGSVYLDEAKRIGHHLLSIVENGMRPLGYRVLSHDLESVYTWYPRDSDETQSGPT